MTQETPKAHGRKLSKTDWQEILNTMEFYKRESGFVDFIGDKLTFFDSDPEFNGIGACFVTIDDVKYYISCYECGITK